ncbi:predicted protein [Streptomyces sp. SPB78]|nr:predicted protein [Streptomyces sp. SPB78]
MRALRLPRPGRGPLLTGPGRYGGPSGTGARAVRGRAGTDLSRTTPSGTDPSRTGPGGCPACGAARASPPLPRPRRHPFAAHPVSSPRRPSPSRTRAKGAYRRTAAPRPLAGRCVAHHTEGASGPRSSAQED